MRYAFFNPAGRIESAHNDDTIDELSPGAVALTDDQWAARFDLLLLGDQLTMSPPVPPVPTSEQLVAQYESELDSFLDSVARIYRYADRTRLALRAGYPNQHQSLALAYGTWMDSCNDHAKQLYSDVVNGVVAMPTISDLISSLPAFVEP